jgi:outer membrane protein assembly factor BamB
VLWSFVGDAKLRYAPVIAGNYVYVTTGANTYVLDRTTHEVVWQTGHGGWLTIANGFLYIVQSDMTLYAYRAQEP